MRLDPHCRAPPLAVQPSPAPTIRHGGEAGRVGAGAGRWAKVGKDINHSFKPSTEEKHVADRKGYPTLLATHCTPDGTGLFFLGKEHIVECFDVESTNDSDEHGGIDKEPLGVYVHPVRVLWAQCADEYLVTLDERGVCRTWAIKYPDQCEHTLPEIVNVGIPMCVGRLGPYGASAARPDEDTIDDDDDGRGRLVCVTTHFPHRDEVDYDTNLLRLEPALPYTNNDEPSHVCVTDVVSGKCLARMMIAREASGVETGIVQHVDEAKSKYEVKLDTEGQDSGYRDEAQNRVIYTEYNRRQLVRTETSERHRMSIQMVHSPGTAGHGKNRKALEVGEKVKVFLKSTKTKKGSGVLKNLRVGICDGIVFQIGQDFSAGDDKGQAKLVIFHYPLLRKDSRKRSNRYNLATLTEQLVEREKKLRRRKEINTETDDSEGAVTTLRTSRQKRAADKKAKQAREESELAGKIVQLQAELEGVFDANRKEERYDFDYDFGAGNAELKVHQATKHIVYVHSDDTWFTNAHVFTMRSCTKPTPMALVEKKWATTDSYRMSSSNPNQLHPRSFRGVFITTIPGDAEGGVHICEIDGSSTTRKIDTTKPRAVLVTHDNCGDDHESPVSGGSRGVSVRDLATGAKCIWPSATTESRSSLSDGASSLQLLQAHAGSIYNVNETSDGHGLAGEVAVSETGVVVVAPKAKKAGEATNSFAVYNLLNPLSGLPVEDEGWPESPSPEKEGDTGGQWVWTNGKRECRWMRDAGKAPSFVVEPRDNRNHRKRIKNQVYDGGTSALPGFSLP